VGGKVDGWGCGISYSRRIFGLHKKFEKRKKINHTSQIPKLGNFSLEVQGVKMNNFSHWLDFKFGIEIELKILE
jgi:hypothetical protein